MQLTLFYWLKVKPATPIVTKLIMKITKKTHDLITRITMSGHYQTRNH